MYQFHHTPLSEEGISQATRVAKRFVQIPVDVVVASPMKRALQTAQEIAKETGKELIECEFFHEILRPTVIRGKHFDDPDVLKIRKHLDTHFGSLDNRHSDEENFVDLKKRAQSAIHFLEERPEQNIVAVTHGHFLKMIMFVMMEQEKAHPAHFENFSNFLHPTNTGVSICVQEENKWRLFSWNDHSHLADS
jgi:probable phosphoglycerate mutase